METLYKLINTLKVSVLGEEIKEFKKPDGYKNVNSSSIKK